MQEVINLEKLQNKFFSDIIVGREFELKLEGKLQIKEEISIQINSYNFQKNKETI